MVDEITSEPVARQNRFASLDVLRGFAVLAIFVVNIKAMLAPFPYYANPSLWSGPYDMTVAALQAFLIDDKWRTIFTALFGAGLVLLAEKSARAGAKPTAGIVRRNLWLLAFGLVHMIGIWIGDILTNYALTGFVAMLFCQKSAKALWAWAIGIFLVAFVWLNGVNLLFLQVPEARAEIEPILWFPGAEELRKVFAIYLSPDPLTHVSARAGEAAGFIPFTVLGGFSAMTLSIMLAGMALWRNGFLKGALSAKTYGWVAIIGLSIAIATDAGRWFALVQSDWSFEVFNYSQLSNSFNGLAGGIGYSALILWLMKKRHAFGPMAAVGRMAFSNYIACSLIGTTLAGGHAFALYSKLSNFEMMGIVAITWIILILFSVAWLSVFHFGPLEWLWRSLTYGRLQP
ncbi:MAG: DUF418 domain-containing protein, partial [Pseudomonadota bacterium]